MVNGLKINENPRATQKEAQGEHRRASLTSGIFVIYLLTGENTLELLQSCDSDIATRK